MNRHNDKVERRAPSTFAPTPGSTVPFHAAELDQLQPATLTNGIIYDLPDNRRVEVWRIKEEEGLCIRIFRPAKDGKISKLLFGLTPDAAAALATGLNMQLSNGAALSGPVRPMELRRLSNALTRLRTEMLAVGYQILTIEASASRSGER